MGDKVNKKRAEIKALKEKKRIEKAQKAEAEALAATARGRSSSRSKKKSKATKIKKKKKRIKNFIMRMNKNQKKLQQIARIGTMTGKKSINNVQRLRPSKKRNECQNWQKKMN